MSWAAKGKRFVDWSFAGCLVREDHIFKALALGAPWAKLIYMGRSVMIRASLGSNIEGVLYPERKAKVNGQWDTLAPVVAELGSHPEEIFAGYHTVQKKLGAQEMKKIPLGAIAMVTLADKLSAGLQQLMFGVRQFKLSEITRSEIFSGNRESEQVTKIPFMMDVQDESAKKILNA